MTELERAVIEAARTVLRNAGDEPLIALQRAMDALDAAGAPGEREIAWSLVAEGDELRSPVNGQFYKITRTQKMLDGKVQITVSLGTAPKTITRPTEKEPTATIRRGLTGQAIDTFVCVLSSGGSE